MVNLFVEGGGDEASLKTECRRAFSQLLTNAGFKNKMPSVKALGGREAAFSAFEAAFKDTVAGEFVMLLVDSETLPAGDDPWAHLNAQARWKRPYGATPDHAQLMVVCMETWLMADPEAFAAYFGKDFKMDILPTANLETREKQEVNKSIASATATTKPKGKYGKARDSFKLLSQIDPAKLKQRCKWANRLFVTLEKLS